MTDQTNDPKKPVPDLDAAAAIRAVEEAMQPAGQTASAPKPAVTYCIYCGKPYHVNASGGFVLCPRIARLEVDPVSGKPTAYEFFPDEEETRGSP